MRIENSYSWNSETKEMEVFLEDVSIAKVIIPDFRTVDTLGHAMERIRKHYFNRGEIAMRDKIIWASNS